MLYVIMNIRTFVRKHISCEMSSLTSNIIY